MTIPASNYAVVVELREMLEQYEHARVMGDAEQQANAAKILDPLHDDPLKYAEAAIAVIEELRADNQALSHANDWQGASISEVGRIIDALRRTHKEKQEHE